MPFWFVPDSLGLADDFEWQFHMNDTYAAGYVVIPIWAIVLAILIPTALLWGRDVRRVIRRRGQCLGCGYDRRATPAGAVCPECGEPVHAALSAPMKA